MAITLCACMCVCMCMCVYRIYTGIKFLKMCMTVDKENYVTFTKGPFKKTGINEKTSCSCTRIHFFLIASIC